MYRPEFRANTDAGSIEITAGRATVHATRRHGEPATAGAAAVAGDGSSKLTGARG